MAPYKFLSSKTFEKLEKFEKRVNEMSSQGWKVVNFTSDNGTMVVLFERIR
ncbi:MAG: hypothetical protein AAF149_05155 [Bacteroidota bacterium]